MKIDRLHNLDYLRGIAAFGIMAYHYTSWCYDELPTELFIKRLGIYGVSVFYVLSGLTLFLVYSNTMKPNKQDLLDFFVKRGFRIMPLLWIVILLSVAIKWLLGGALPGLGTVFLNITGLFGLVAWDKSIGTGVWSIGNELVFYLFFPFFMLLYNKQRSLLAVLTLFLLSIYCYYAYSIMPGYGDFRAGADTYVNPLNQVFLFLGGFLIGAFFQNMEARSLPMLLLLMASLIAFTFYPVSGDAIELVSGSTRMVFTMICFLVCLSVYKTTYVLPGVMDKPLRLLGEVSYSLYLLHPLVWKTAGLVLRKAGVPSLGLIVICGLISLFCSYISYQYFEKYFVKAGRRLLSKIGGQTKPKLVKQ